MFCSSSWLPTTMLTATQFCKPYLLLKHIVELPTLNIFSSIVTIFLYIIYSSRFPHCTLSFSYVGILIVKSHGLFSVLTLMSVAFAIFNQFFLSPSSCFNPRDFPILLLHYPLCPMVFFHGSSSSSYIINPDISWILIIDFLFSGTFPVLHQFLLGIFLSWSMVSSFSQELTIPDPVLHFSRFTSP